MQSRLLAVHKGGDMYRVMIFALFLMLAEPTQQISPVVFTNEQQRDISCVAVIAIAADAQRRDGKGMTQPSDLTQDGKRWAAMVGARIMEQSGAPRELVAIAMTEAAKAEQVATMKAQDPKNQILIRRNTCLPLMQADLLANAPLPKPVKSK